MKRIVHPLTSGELDTSKVNKTYEKNENANNNAKLLNELTTKEARAYYDKLQDGEPHVIVPGISTNEKYYLDKQVHCDITLTSVNSNLHHNPHQNRNLADCHTVKETCSKVRELAHDVASFLGFALLTNWTMWLLLLGFFFQTLGMLTPLFFLPVRLYETDSLGAGSIALLISLIGATDTTGRLMFGALGTVLGNTALRPVVMFAVLSALAGLASLLSTVLPTSTPALAVYTSLYGLFLGKCNKGVRQSVTFFLFFFVHTIHYTDCTNTNTTHTCTRQDT